ncbi:FERM domain-containing protein 4B, partial [Toxocara canis]
KNLQTHRSGLDLTELSEKLSRLISQSSIGSSLPSLSSLNSLSGGMRSAKVADGSCTSLPSLNSGYSHKSEEEKQRDLELYRELKRRKNELEEKLLAKLEELREVCIKEAEITGEMPKEIYKTLMPGEPEPKVKRRVGTAFCLSEEVFKRPFDNDDKLTKLETDVELHRKIVAAAERLAKDKSMNKSVRKKRQKDLIAATQKLRGLEMGLNQLRLSASKPDVSSTDHSTANGKRSWSSCASHAATPCMTRTGGSLVAKSCPTTPRGSVPDLSATDNEKSETEEDEITPQKSKSRCSQRLASGSSQRNAVTPRSTNNYSCSSAGANGLPPTPTRRPTLPMTKLVANMQMQQTGDVRLSADDLDNPLEVDVKSRAMSDSTPHLPLYENVGYKTYTSYKSSYRETNFPTLNDVGSLKSRVPRAHSEHSLPQPEGEASASSFVSNSEFRPNYADSRRHDIGMYSVSPQTTSWDCRSVEQGLNRDYSKASESENMRFKHPWNETSEVNSRGMVIPQSGITSTGTTATMSALSHKRLAMPMSHSYTGGIDTASLDRRAVRNRQSSFGSVTKFGGTVGGGCDATVDGRRYDSSSSSTSTSQLISHLSPMSAPRVTTTFPVARGPGLVSIETSKPLESVDVQRYQQRSPLVSQNNLLSSISPKRSVTSSPNHRPPPPSYTSALRATANGMVLGNGSPLAKVTPTNTDPHMEALLDYYKDAANRKGKTATIV